MTSNQTDNLAEKIERPVSNGVTRVVRHDSRRYKLHNKFDYFYWLVGAIMSELRSGVTLSPRDTLHAWRQGFSRFNYRLYGLEDGRDTKDYMSNRRAIRQVALNGRYGHMLHGKLSFACCMKAHNIPHPETLGMLRLGTFYPFAAEACMSLEDLLTTHCAKEGDRLVAKANWGSHGHRLHIIKRVADHYEVNGTKHDLASVATQLSNLHDFVVTHFLHQGPYGAGLFAGTVNTIRIVTLIDPDNHQPFVARAVQRIGTARTLPVDNFKAGRGGLSVAIDLATGTLGAGAMSDQQGHLTWHAEHPETGAAIEGVVVPQWEEMKHKLLAYAQIFSFVPYLAWDLVPTENGFVVLETNLTPGLPVMQVHGPFLADPRVRRFFQYYRVLP
jgi:hypothetical protein